jgi:hypothetical protein
MKPIRSHCKFYCVIAAVALLAAAAIVWKPDTVQAGESAPSGRYQVLAPISQGNLTIFPVVASSTHDTHEFLTLDEGLRSGEVEVTEAGRIQPLVRRPRQGLPAQQYQNAEVNRLVLVNHSKQPLLLLAGEIVTGGKQDRIVGKDRIVPADSDTDLNVFCVEPGRWTESSAKFGGLAFQMAQPSIRSKAMAEKDQHAVWDEVRKSHEGMALAAPSAAPYIGETSSYAKMMDNKEVQQSVNRVAAPIELSYENLMHELRARNAVGVVVAVNGRIIWADLFASNSLLEKYWPKLVRSYAAEAVETRYGNYGVSLKAAQQFLEQLEGRREIVENEPGVYRHAEISGDGYKVFALTSLLPGTGFDVHISKMAE